MSEHAKRLRELAQQAADGQFETGELDFIEALQGAADRLEALETAIDPFARAGADIPRHWSDDADAVRWSAGKHPWFMTVGDFRRATEAKDGQP